MTNLVLQHLAKIGSSRYILLIIIISISAFTHMWNPTGFPSLFTDENIYIRRAMQVLEGTSPQEPVNVNEHPYDHPYFAALFLASVFNLIGFPDSLNSVEGTIYSIETLYAIPRVIIGILAVIDTFLIYKISEIRYNRRVAIIASILFAVMPLTWLTRRILLDSIMLPFILSSIFFAVYYNKKIKIESTSRNVLRDKKENKFSDPRTILILISGIFLGLAIFTKVPALCMIPLVGYLIFSTGKGNDSKHFKNLKAVGIWLIPIIIIPTIWPIYSISVGQFSDWWNDVQWQERRGGEGIASLMGIYNMDPVLVALGFLGSFFAIAKRDYFIFLWVITFLVYLGISGWVLKFHYIMLLPALCISSGVLIGRLSEVRILERKKKSLLTISDYYPGTSEAKRARGTGLNNPMTNNNSFFPTIRNALSPTKLAVFLVTGIVIFGLAVTSVLITADLNSTWIEVIAFMTQFLPSEENIDDKEVTVFFHRNLRDLLWIAQYVFDKDYDYRMNSAKIKSWEVPTETERVILLVEKWLTRDLDSESTRSGVIKIKTLYKNTEPTKTFEEKQSYNDFLPRPYDGNFAENKGIGRSSEVRTNH